MIERRQAITGERLSAFNTVSPLQAALGYAALGLPVFPVAPLDRATGACGCREGAACEAVAKHPLVAWADRATTDRHQIERWWAWKPDANIGIPTGARSGLIAVDIDRQHDGPATRQALAEAGYRFPPTLAQRTRNGGWHFVYQAPEGTRVANTTAALAGIGDTPGIDVRGDGGYIIVAPSIRPLDPEPVSGELRFGRYAWAAQDLAPAPAPTWVTAPLARPAPIREPPVARAETGRGGRDPHKRAAAALAAEVARVADAPSAARNTRLFQAAANLFEIVNTGYLDEGQVRAELTAAAHQVGLGEGEIRATLDAQWRRKQGVRRSGWDPSGPGPNQGPLSPRRMRTMMDVTAPGRSRSDGFGR